MSDNTSLQFRKLPLFATIMMVLSIGQIIFTLGMYGVGSADAMLLTLLALSSIILTSLAVFAWDRMDALQKAVRGMLIGLPTVFLLAAVVFAVREDPSGDVMYNIAVGASLTLMFVQLFIVFMLPLLCAMASYGARIDRILLHVMALVNAASIPFFLYYSAVHYGMPDVSNDNTTLQVVYIVYACVFAVLTFVPAICKRPTQDTR